jgi:hypothetical protein
MIAAGSSSGHGRFANEAGAAGIIALTYGKIAGETMVADLRGNL